MLPADGPPEKWDEEHADVAVVEHSHGQVVAGLVHQEDTTIVKSMCHGQFHAPIPAPTKSPTDTTRTRMVLVQLVRFF